MKLKTSNVIVKAKHYIASLFFTEKKKRNIERMAEQNNQDYQSQQHFITHSPWSAKDVMTLVAKKANKSFGDPKLQCLLIDESSDKKAGKHSVGVSRQHNGNLGKIENSQTGVYASLAKEDYACLVNCRLFLPEQWTNDEERCLNAGIPKSDIVFKTKPQLAIEMIEELEAAGIQYRWVGADSLYGRNYEFRNALQALGKKFVVDIQEDHHIYMQPPNLYIPERKTNRGQKPKRYISDSESITVQQYMLQSDNSEWKHIKYRNGTKQPMNAFYLVKTVWVWKPGDEQYTQYTLIIKKIKEEIKYSFSNFNLTEISIEELAYMQGQRYLIEKSFKDSKGELGLFDYQIRKYMAWYHHNALVMMAMHFVLEKILEHKEKIPLLSVRDVRLQMIPILRKNNVMIEQEIRQMKKRHFQRAYDIIRSYFKLE
jgi:SRSO17 transposase